VVIETLAESLLQSGEVGGARCWGADGPSMAVDDWTR
jgi:hypothetical protein